MRERERGDRLDQPKGTSDKEGEPDYKQDVIEAEQQVLHTQAQVAPRGAALAAHDPTWLFWS